MKNLLLILIASILLGLAARAAVPATESPIPTPRPCVAVDGSDYLYESYMIAWKISEEGYTGRLWAIDGASLPAPEAERYCKMVLWADPTAACGRGPCPVGSAGEALVKRVWLPLVLR